MGHNVSSLVAGAEAVVLPQLRNGTGESPVWDAEAGAFFWVDIANKQVHRFHLSSGALCSWTLPEHPGCIVRRQSGDWLVACESGVYELRLAEDGGITLTLCAPADHAAPRMRFNDGRCDRQGRLVVSDMMLNSAERQPVGQWFRYAGGNAMQAIGLGGFTVPNGLAFSPDGRTLYCSDAFSPVRTVWACDYDADEGMPSRRRVFIDFHAHVGRPDGATVDCDGCYWICATDAGRLLRFRPDGELDLSIELPVRNPTMAAFGGDDMRTMLITSLRRPGADEGSDPLAGCVMVVRPGQQGLPEPRYGV